MALAQAAKGKFRDLLGSQNVLESDEARQKASRDETHGLSPYLPDAVLLPLNHEHVVGIARICSAHRIAMTPRGAGTGKSGGCVPVEGGVVLDFSRMNRIIDVNSTDFTAVVEPGVVLGHFQRHVEALGLYYPPDPASLEWCTLGGNVAENAGGPSAVKYGVTRDYLLGLRLVFADGRSMRIGKKTIKGVTGLDLVSLLCGSEGVLAFITEITLRLLPRPTFVQAALCLFESREAAVAASVKARACGAQPRCIEFVDSGSLEALRVSGRITNQPFGGASALLLVEVDGSNSEQLLDAFARMDAAFVGQRYLGMVLAKDEKERREFWDIRRSLSEATKKLSKFKVSEDVVVPLSRLNEFLDDADVLSRKHGIRICTFGHAGDGNLHVQVLFDDEKIKKRLPSILGELFEIVLRHKGTLTGEHGVGVAKKRFLSLEQETDVIDLQRRIKIAFDPIGLLNPGKFL